MSLDLTHNGKAVASPSYIGQTRNLDFLSQNLRLRTVSGFDPLPLRWYEITQAAVDVFVYDTRQDSDGGAWTNGPLAQASSWYNETLSTATRGSRRDFPKVAVIVAEATRLVIYDGEDPALPMWAIYTPAGGATFGKDFWYLAQATSVAANEGVIFFGLSSGSATRTGVAFISLLDDEVGRYAAASTNGGYGLDASSGSKTQTLPAQFTVSIVNGVVNDVAARVLPGAPTDPTTGLKVPTVLVGTDGGLSIIKDNGTVVDVVHSGSSFVRKVGWRESDNAICYATDPFANFGRFRAVLHDVPTTDLSLGSVWLAGQTDELYPVYPFSSYTGTSFPLSPSPTMAPAGGWFGEVDGGNQQLTLFAPKPADPANGMRAVVTSNYNTGWMHGDTVGSFMCDTSTAALVGGTDNDRSPYNTPLSVSGTITRTAVATGADIVAYSGFSASNYLEQPYNSNLDFGTGDFCVMGWIKTSGSGWAVARFDSASYGMGLFGTPTSLFFKIGVTSSVNDLVATVPSNTWLFAVVSRVSGVLSMHINGDMAATVANSETVNGAGNAKLNIGALAGASSFAGSLALWRISATAPDADQIAKIYADELKLFQPDAACTLAGTSSDVRAVDYDRTTGRVQALASDGWRSAFENLIRVEEQSTGKSVALSATGNRIAAV